jgi:hypothetical protein
MWPVLIHPSATTWGRMGLERAGVVTDDGGDLYAGRTADHEDEAEDAADELKEGLCGTCHQVEILGDSFAPCPDCAA